MDANPREPWPRPAPDVKDPGDEIGRSGILDHFMEVVDVDGLIRRLAEGAENAEKDYFDLRGNRLPPPLQWTFRIHFKIQDDYPKIYMITLIELVQPESHPTKALDAD